MIVIKNRFIANLVTNFLICYQFENNCAFSLV